MIGRKQTKQMNGKQDCVYQKNPINHTDGKHSIHVHFFGMAALIGNIQKGNQQSNSKQPNENSSPLPKISRTACNAHKGKPCQ